MRFDKYECFFDQSDINEHLPLLNLLCRDNHVVVELGGIGALNSTRAILRAKPKNLLSVHDESTVYNRTEYVECRHLSAQNSVNWALIIAESLSLDIPECDCLFIDTKHTYRHLSAELNLHAASVKNVIVIHDTHVYGDHSEDNSSPGLIKAVDDFLQVHREWETLIKTDFNHGLTVLQRRHS